MVLPSGQLPDPSAQAALRLVLEGTASEIGEGFFRALVENLARVLGTRGAWVTEFDPRSRRLRALAFKMGEEWVEGFEQPVDGTPCQVVIDGRRLVHYPDRVLELYPGWVLACSRSGPRSGSDGGPALFVPHARAAIRGAPRAGIAPRLPTNRSAPLGPAHPFAAPEDDRRAQVG
jgi:hypothetical protein